MSEQNPTQIVILGGSGDLSKRKLLPALFDLYLKEKLPKDFSIIGLARTPRSDEEYRFFVYDVLTNADTSENTHASIRQFCSHIKYISGTFAEVDSYTKLADELTGFDEENAVVSNVMFYLAVPPEHYGVIFPKLSELSKARKTDKSWSRILVEKPFGNDYHSAQELDCSLGELFNEEQIFRIDHYLAKEAVQNILAFRFSNPLLSVPWNSTSVESVRICMNETVDVSERGAFYDKIGALRDVGQNHLLQLLALVAMAEPASLSDKDIRQQRTAVLEALHPLAITELDKHVIRGQYDTYAEADGVESNSTTETYFALRATLNLPQWENVPFYITAGKALGVGEVKIEVSFRDKTTGPFSPDSCISRNNLVVLTISPEQKMAITLNAKAPGLNYQLEERTLNFTCSAGESEIKNSYEKVLIDCIEGDQTLFTSSAEVLAAWRFISPIIDNWTNLPLHKYEIGSDGPDSNLLV